VVGEEPAGFDGFAGRDPFVTEPDSTPVPPPDHVGVEPVRELIVAPTSHPSTSAWCEPTPVEPEGGQVVTTLLDQLIARKDAREAQRRV
jgi:hypothetical protein